MRNRQRYSFSSMSVNILRSNILILLFFVESNGGEVKSKKYKILVMKQQYHFLKQEILFLNKSFLSSLVAVPGTAAGGYGTQKGTGPE